MSLDHLVLPTSGIKNRRKGYSLYSEYWVTPSKILDFYVKQMYCVEELGLVLEVVRE